MLFRGFSLNSNRNTTYIQLNNTFRKLWSDHVFWTRFFINSTAFDNKDLEFVTNRLLQNPADFAKVFSQFYGEKIASEFEKLLTEHLTIAAELVNAAKSQDSAQVAELEKQWYQNANDIAVFLNKINPYWSTKVWQQMMSEHLKLTEQEAVQVLTGEYQESIMSFDEIYRQALMMADEMTNGIAKQFKIN